MTNDERLKVRAWARSLTRPLWIEARDQAWLRFVRSGYRDGEAWRAFLHAYERVTQ